MIARAHVNEKLEKYIITWVKSSQGRRDGMHHKIKVEKSLQEKIEETYILYIVLKYKIHD